MRRIMVMADLFVGEENEIGTIARAVVEKMEATEVA